MSHSPGPAISEFRCLLASVEGVAKASGMKLSADSANVWEFRDGLASRLVIYAHAANALRDAGIQEN
jgi:hypothetical protein